MKSSVAGIVLASGMSTRFGHANKLLARVGGVSVVERTVGAYADAGVRPLLVVVGYAASEIQHALVAHPAQCVFNPEFRLGQSRALIRGIGALPGETDAVVLGVADQPFLTPAIIRSLVDRYARERSPLVAPRYAGENGNPILFDRSLFAELLQVEGDQGGRPVVQRHRDRISWVDITDVHAARDIDTIADLEAMNRETP